jgi:hypothetical protein
MIVRCNKCENEFELKALQEETKQFDKQEVTEHYFICPCCGTRYLCYVHNVSTRTLLEQIQRKKILLNYEKDPVKKKRKRKELDKKEARLKKEMNILKTKYQKYIKNQEREK